MNGHDVPLDYHRVLLDDLVRVDAYERAIRQLVRPGDVVLDVGTGTGLLAMLAARRGARVHAVESMPIAELARELIAANGLSDRITVHRADLCELEAIEPVDLIVGDWLGRFLVDDGMVQAVEAAGRWATAATRWCPSEVRLRIAPVGDFAHPPVDLFRGGLLGLDLGPGLRRALDTCYAVQLDAAHALGAAATWAVQRPPALVGGEPVGFTVARDGQLRGFAGWFEADLAPGLTLSTAPGVPTHWGQYLFPLAPRPVRAGDEISLEVRLSGDGWSWSGEVAGEAFEHRSDRCLGPARPEVRARSPLDRGEIIEGNRVAAEALLAGRVADALGGFEALAAGLRPDDDDLACAVYENLGLAALNRGDLAGAARAFARALDGDPGSRRQSLERLAECAARLGRADAAHWLAEYERRYGPHPLRG